MYECAYIHALMYTHAWTALLNIYARAYTPKALIHCHRTAIATDETAAAGDRLLHLQINTC